MARALTPVEALCYCKSMTNEMSDFEAYRILTSELTNMHHTERDALDSYLMYHTTLDAVKAGNNALAISLALPLVTEAGDKWRAKQDKPFIN